MTRRVLAFFSLVVLSGVVGCASTTVGAHTAVPQTTATTAGADRTLAVLRGDSSRAELRASDPSFSRDSLNAITAEPTATAPASTNAREPQFAGPTPQIPIPTSGGRAGIASID